jgi:VWFA-related protein
MKLVLMAAIAAAGATLAAQSQPRFGTRVDLQVVSAIARNADNSLARGLTRDDFELLEDGKPMPIATFAEVNTDSRASLDDGRFIVLLLDDLATNPIFTTRIKEVAHAFVDRMGPKDVMSVTFLDGSSGTTTQSRGELHKAIDRRQGFGRAQSSPPGAGHTMKTIGSLSTQLARVAHRRKLIVCIGPAGAFNPNDLRSYTADAIRDTARADVTTYVVDPLGLTERFGLAQRPIDAGGIPRTEPSTVDKGAGFQIYNGGGFIHETGGLVFANTNMFGPVVDQVWQEAGNYYLLGYEPPRRDNKRHSIEVKVKRPDVQVRARRTRG